MHNIELNGKLLTAIAKYINAKNEASEADFPVISTDDLQEPKVRGSNIITLANGGIKGTAKHTVPYTDLNFRKAGRPKKTETAKEDEATKGDNE